ncbi:MULTISPECIES: hypothetical protein [Bacillus]|uniref:hypothetical protein n=1 Tax=Bacillus TaxID=1386 RepID=UPI0027A424CD|nr:hypothetical protein [Bacillus altitudinis]WGV00324.1 hypothetical protein QJS56_17585 [Bacillus altitudinis]WOI41977.1 hypothetical protein RZ534_03370 [Bacillus altitudinis]
MKKVFILILMLTLVSTGFSPFISSVNAEVNNSVIPINSTYEYEVLTDKPTYQKIKIVNKETGEVEYLESFKKNNEYSYIATTKDAVYDIESVEKGVTVTNRGTGKEEITVSKFDEIVEDKSSIMQTRSSWSTVNSYKSSSSLNTTVVTTIAGIIASIYGGPVTGVAVTIAAAYASIKAPNTYFRVQEQAKVEGNAYYRRNVFKWYKYHDYTKYLGQTTSKTWRIR